LNVGTALSLGGGRQRKIILDYRSDPIWVQNHETITNLNDYMKSICDGVISRVIGQDYITEFPNILYNNGAVSQQKYHRDFKYVYSESVKKNNTRHYE